MSNTEYLPAENNPAHQTSGLRPLFNAKLDGPLLKDPLRLKLITTSGDIEIVLDPSIAPCTASQMAKLFQSGAFDATRLVRHTPGFYLQVGAAEDKSLNASLKRDSYSLLRRLPLETSDDKNAQHSKYSLSMSRDPADENSAISSFTILLCDAPHMNGKYTVFGHLANDDQTLATIQRITSDWDAERPTIVEVKAAKSVATASKRN